MTEIKTQTKPHLLVSAAELLVHRARFQLTMHIGGQVDENFSLEVLEHRLAGPEGRAWSRLIELFGLSDAEADLLALALAVTTEPALGSLVAQAQEAEGRFLPTEPLIKLMHNHPARPIWKPTSPLSMWRLVTPIRIAPGECEGFQADRQLVDWMFGNLSLDAELVLAIDACPAEPAPVEWPVSETAERLDHALRTGNEQRLIIQGRSGSGRRSFASAVAQKLGRKALVAEPQVIPTSDWAEAFMLAQRFTLFADAALIWREGSLTWPVKIPMAPLQFICTTAGVVPPPRDGASDLTVTLPEPGIESKAAVFAALVPDLAEEAPQLAATPGLLLGDLKEVGRTAPRTLEEATNDLRARARSRLQGAGHVVDPVFSWEDMVASKHLLTQLERITFEARTRPMLMERAETARLYHRAAGLSALFSGPPGVGKSMAAHVIARDLGSNLLVVDLASTTSKFIGETAKNLSEAFAQAKASGSALIFEEADAFFAKRTDVRDSNDRYANTDTNHLLQLLEAHDGLVILSTNRRANIDPAFIRRLRHVVEFPKPGAAERCELWQRMLVGLGTNPEPLIEVIDRLASNYDLSPAQIKSAALSALYSALHEDRSIETGDLIVATELELTKEGRTMSASNSKPRRQRSPQNV